MSYQSILVRREGSTQVITLNRPQRRNAISLQMMAEIMAAAQEAEDVAAVRALVITGGSDCFSAGADLTEAIEVKTAADGLRYFGSLHRLNASLEALSKPVIAAIEGFCITGGCELALACDLRVAGEGATFAITSSRIGTVAGAGGTQRLPRIVGMANALELLFSAESMDATEALRIGLINGKTERGGALGRALAMAALYAERAPLSLAFAKRAVRRGMEMDLASGLELETYMVSCIYGTRDKGEGISAFLEKRKAEFKGE
ncbi:MAG: enoyl-CoA hydratase/isomerase family protein [Hyphomicrobiaceae bacterium]|nr:enoyl-CoA hydratase/isomerase family protein [Hyphomicrobiaceae bacterium]